MQIVMVQLFRNERLVPFHRTVEGLSKQLWSLGDPSRQRHKPLGSDQLELAALRLIHQDLWFHRIKYGTNKLRVQEMDPHATFFVVHATERREIAVANREDGVFVLRKDRAHGRQIRR
ncbi:hypothetical protein TSO221_32185 [Azospirillum sp. TSO22-1]|nr:hypothetical protein TSO221_32185 [Azospirillum sp. TSO22-1]